MFHYGYNRKVAIGIAIPKNVGELENFILEAINSVDEKCSINFEDLKRCHCWPVTEWYGDVISAFHCILNENAIHSI